MKQQAFGTTRVWLLICFLFQLAAADDFLSNVNRVWVVIFIFVILAFVLFIVIAATIYLLNRCLAHSIRKEFLKQVTPSMPMGEIIKPQSGEYLGYFKQGEKTYEISVKLGFTFERTRTVDGGRVDYYKVTGTGKDYRGIFRISKGGCTVGDQAHISFYKHYTLLEKGQSKKLFNKLLNTGKIRSSLPDIISGDWQFVNMEPTDKCPHPYGKFRLEKVRERTSSRVNTEEQKSLIEEEDEELLDNAVTPLLPQHNRKPNLAVYSNNELL